MIFETVKMNKPPEQNEFVDLCGLLDPWAVICGKIYTHASVKYLQDSYRKRSNQE
jgi:hypothetical protein